MILIRNRFELTGLPSIEKKADLKISVCIPARNEENTLPVLLPTVFSQKGVEFEVIVLNDGSTDRTGEVLNSFSNNHADTLRVVDGIDKPADWLGKPWACMQLSRHASPETDLLLFLDADTKLRPGTLQGIASAFREYKSDMITVWPQQILGTFWEKTVMPLVYYGLISVLPAVYVYRKPRWMPKRIYVRVSSMFAAANGQCIAFKKDAYQIIGGHEAVKQQIVEDVELAKAAKRAGLTVRMFHGTGSVLCRMYKNQSELFTGLRKNFLAGFGYSIPLFLSAAILHLIVFILPFAALLWSLFYPSAAIFSLSALSVTLILFHRLMLSIWFQWDPIYSFTHPIGVLWFQWLGLVKLYDHFTGKKVNWKGRNV
ncbi:glycosyltransferase [Rhodohalobacter mucosus]|uniref:glycosyltransferase n=1 Tax=Rhodohalobacter mucosus TaxID=2079485 RepID=UPI001304B130|nr:glycosyltransferase family 2 protein [Rhodohalobacter mucosus]